MVTTQALDLVTMSEFGCPSTKTVPDDWLADCLTLFRGEIKVKRLIFIVALFSLLTAGCTVGGVAGPPGADGKSGATGSDGATGASGATGVSGSQGADGATGVSGSTGATGATGAAGAEGAKGRPGDR